MDKNIPIEELAAKVIEELEKLNYSPKSLERYRRCYRHFIAYACARDEKHFSESLGADFLNDKYGCRTDVYPMPKRLKNYARMLRVLGDYQLHKVVFRRVVKKTPHHKPRQFEEILSAYEVECQRHDFQDVVCGPE